MTVEGAGFDVVALMKGAAETLTAPGSLFELCEEEVRGNTMAVFANRMTSMRDLIEGTTRFADRTYLIEGDRHISYRTHLEYVDRFAAALQSTYDVRPGDRVALHAANRWEWVVAFWGITSAGAIPVLYNGYWTDDETAHADSLVEPALTIGDERRLARLSNSDMPTFDLDGTDDLLAAHRDVERRVVDVDEDDPALLIFTSGSTGRPKAVTAAHRGLCGLVQVNLFLEGIGHVLMGGTTPRVDDPMPPVDDVVLATSPLFHTSMISGVVLRMASRGGTGVLLPGRFDPERVLEAIDRHQVTSWLALGSAAPRVATCPALDRYDTTTLKQVGVGGAPVSPTTQQQIRDAFPAASSSLSMGYASTESVSLVASIAGPEFLEHPTSTGRAVVTVDLEIRGVDGRPLPEGELGEIHVRSPYIMLGYWNDSDATSAVLKPEGWLAMGDLGRVVDGRLYIDTRARDMILVSAENVSPTEVEYRLDAHADVVEATVFAVDDELTGDAVCAVVVTDPAATVTAEQLDAWCRDSLAPYKVPTQWHLVHEQLPRTASGKILKEQVRQLVEPMTR